MAGIEAWMYWLFAFVQAVITTRVIKEHGFVIVVFTLFAPVVSVIWILMGSFFILEVLAKYENK